MIEPLQARTSMLEELRRWLHSGRQLPSVRELAVALGMPHAQATEALADLERLGDVRLRRLRSSPRRWVVHVADRVSWAPSRAFRAPHLGRIQDDAPVRDAGLWPAHAKFADDHRAGGDCLVFAPIPAAEGRSLTGSTAAWVAEG